MERFNPFANSCLTDDPNPLTTSFTRPSPQINHELPTDSSTSSRYVPASPRNLPTTTTTGIASTRYSTTFPDPFGESEPVEPAVASSSNRSNSVTFAPTSHSIDDPFSTSSPTRTSGRQASGGFTSFLSRATSVTSSSVTDRVSGAVGSVRSAVDSISNQIQQAVPTNLNERLSSTATNLINSGDQLQQQSAASYLASKFSSATGQFTSTGQNLSSLPVISRQRVILILDNYASTDWAQQFNNYRRITTGSSSAPSTAQSALTSFFSSATAQLTSSSPSSSSSNSLPPSNSDGFNLVEQADFRDVSVLANQTTSTATIHVTNNRSASNARISSKIIRPEYVVVKQRTKDGLDHLRGIVTALNYCLVPTFEPFEVWNIFQDRQLIFAKLLRVQKTLGKESFPLIPQIYCQTHNDLLNYINSSSLILPCLVRTGPLGKGKIKMDNLQMLRDFASIVATSGLSCTVEQYLDVKCDLIIQKLGTISKLFKRNIRRSSETSGGGGGVGSRLDKRTSFGNITTDNRQDQQQFARQSASRQTSLSNTVLSSLINPASSLQQHQPQHQQQLARCSSSPISNAGFEKLSDVNIRYKNWVETIVREFDNKLEAFCIKIVVANNDKEYIVGLNDCSMDFIGNLDNQEEDRRSFVELIVSNMNTNLPKNNISRESSSNITSSSSSLVRRRSSNDKEPTITKTISSTNNATNATISQTTCHNQQDTHLGDEKKFISQTQIDGAFPVNKNEPVGRGYGQLGNRSQSVSVNKSDFLSNEQANKPYFIRRGSDRSDSLVNETEDSSLDVKEGGTTSSSSSGLHQRQASMGQSFLDQTSTAFSSFQKQSISFFKRLDSRAGDVISATQPQSSKSDKGLDQTFVLANLNGNMVTGGKNGFKSQSIDTLDNINIGNRSRRHDTTPKKPPPPQTLGNRQSSLASYSTTQRGITSSVTPYSGSTQTRQNSFSPVTAISAGDGSQQRGRVVRQNSALSAFEPFDPDLTERSEKESKDRTGTAVSSCGHSQTGDIQNKSLESAKRSTNYDSASITSGDSNSTGETTTAEDTMNNLKKTFASIFGDKCE